MKKCLFVSVIILLFTLSAISATLYVPGQYATIQAAVNASSTGDTVLVASGVYYEHVETTVGIYLIGQDMYSTIIDAEGEDKCIYVNAVGSFGKISGFTLKSSGTGYTGGTANCAICLKTYGTGAWEVTGNYIKENLDTGILSFDSGIIHHNIFENNGSGGGFARAIFVSSYSNNTIAHNDFKGNVTAIYAHNATVSLQIKNNLIFENQVGINLANNVYTIAYNDVWNNGSNYVSCGPGLGDISLDPLCVGGAPYCYFLTAGSPCIDAGDPSLPPDPDGTIADIGAFFYYQGGILLEVTLTPVNPPIQIPQSGGEFDFNIAVSNTGINPIIFDVWTMVTLPSGGEYGPIINFQGFNIGGGSSADRDRNQSVPENAPAGIYSYDAFVGVYPFSIWSEDSFDFEKLTDGDGPVYHDWENRGNEFISDSEAIELKPSHAPEDCNLLSAYPNPFNPNTTVSLILDQTDEIHLSVYDVQGRVISTLAEGHYQAGRYEFNFDGVDLPSGVYFLYLTTESSTSSEKLILIK